VVKPSSHGSAIGVSRVGEDAPPGELERAIEAAWALDPFAVIEHFARGREVTCGVLDLDGPTALPPTEILSPSDPFYTYEARYAPGRSVHRCPAPLPVPVLARVQEVALGAHAALGCRDLCRVDFIVGDDGDPDAVTLLEVNTLPGMTATSLFPEAAAVHGLPMARWCDALVVRAHARGPARRPPARPLPQ
jgi:D-alanine-D-alanine ligase